jgi:WD40 repeat protein
LYSIQQQQQINCKLIQTFPKEHSSDHWISSLLQINPNTLISSAWSSSYSYSPSDNSIVIWSKSKSSSSSSLEYEPVQRITHKETGGRISRLVLIKQKKEEEEEQFASCSYSNDSDLIWRRGKGGKGDKFQIKQKITNVKNVQILLYISLTNELISGSSSPSLLHIWSPSSSSFFSSSSDFVERQKIQTPSDIRSLCQLNENKNRIEFASGHTNGQIMIWSKEQQQEINYSLSKTLQPLNNNPVWDLIFLNCNNKGFNHFLISCSPHENKIVIYKGEEKEEEELEHKDVARLIPMSNGQFASGGDNKCLNIWSPSS